MNNEYGAPPEIRTQKPLVLSQRGMPIPFRDAYIWTPRPDLNRYLKLRTLVFSSVELQGVVEQRMGIEPTFSE